MQIFSFIYDMISRAKYRLQTAWHTSVYTTSLTRTLANNQSPLSGTRIRSRYCYVRDDMLCIILLTDCMEIIRTKRRNGNEEKHFCASFVRFTIINKSFVVLFFVLNDPNFSVHYTVADCMRCWCCVEFLCLMLEFEMQNMLSRGKCDDGWDGDLSFFCFIAKFKLNLRR